MSAPEPIATGTLAKTPLPHLLVYLEQKKLYGTLAIWPEPEDTETKRQDRILLLKGIPVAGKLIEPTTNLREGMLQAVRARARAVRVLRHEPARRRPHQRPRRPARADRRVAARDGAR